MSAWKEAVWCTVYCWYRYRKTYDWNEQFTERWSCGSHTAWLSVVMTCISVFQRASFIYQSRREWLASKRRGSLTHCCYERHLSNSNVPGRTSSNSASLRVKLSVSSWLRAAASTTSSNRRHISQHSGVQSVTDPACYCVDCCTSLRCRHSADLRSVMMWHHHHHHHHRRRRLFTSLMTNSRNASVQVMD